MLKQETEERSVPIWHTPTQLVQETTPRVNQTSVSRTDAEEILQRAALLQSDEMDRISVAELESLAIERGISPRFVRQALQTHHRPQVQHSTPSAIAPVRLTQKQWQVAGITVALYWLLTTALPMYLSIMMPFLNATPLFIAAGLGYYLRYKRAGAVAGLALLLATSTSIMAQNGPGALPLLLSLYSFITWMLAGVVGAALRQWIATRQLPYEPTVLTASDLDR